MTDALVKMKDGRTYCNPIWMWRPKEGWLSLIATGEGEPDKIWLRDVESAVEKGQRVGIEIIDGERRPKIRDVDLLERARADGWNGE
jgi:hypothetical protein